MTSQVLGIISNTINSVVPYEFGRWSGNVPDTYCVGEYMTTPIATEDWAVESTMILTITTRGAFQELLHVQRRISHAFDPLTGLRASTYYGSVAIFYENAFPVETGEADLKRMQINLRIKQWKTFGGK